MAIKTCTGTTSQPYVHVQVRLSQACTITATGADAPVVTNATGDVNGAYSITLWANGDLTPSPTFYTVTEFLGATDNTFTIIVPQTAGPFTMASITQVAPAAPLGGTLATINAAGDGAFRSITVSSSSPYTQTAVAGGGDFSAAVRITGGRPWADPSHPTYGGGVSATGAANTTAINQAITDINALGGGEVLLNQPGGWAVSGKIVMKSKVTLRGLPMEWSVQGYSTDPTPYHTTWLTADGTAAAVVEFGTAVVGAAVVDLLIAANGRTAINLVATTNRNGNRLRNVYASFGGSPGIYVGAAETRMRDVIVMKSAGDGIQIDGLDCELDTLLSGYNAGSGVVVGVTAQNANVLRGTAWDVFFNTLDGIQLNGDGHRLASIQGNNNGRRGLAFLTNTNTRPVHVTMTDNGREYDGATHLTRYPDVEFAHPTASNSGCGIIGGKISTGDGAQSYAVKNSEVVVSFPQVSDVAFGGTYNGGSGETGYINPQINIQVAGSYQASALFVPQAGVAGIRVRPNGSADLSQWLDGSGTAVSGVDQGSRLYTLGLTVASTEEATGTFGWTMPRASQTNSTQAQLTSGTLRLVATYLSKGQVVNALHFVSGSTALVAGGTPHVWFALFDGSLNLLASTADDTAPVWAALSIKDYNIARNAAGGAIASYTILTSGLYYLGVMTSVGTPPNLSMALANGNVTGLAPKLEGNSTAGLTTTPPNPAAALTSQNLMPIAWCS